MESVYGHGNAMWKTDGPDMAKDQQVKVNTGNAINVLSKSS